MIKITNLDVFKLTQNAVSKDDTRLCRTGVYIEPDGTVTGTDGHGLTSGQAVDPESMEGRDAFILKTKAFPASVHRAEIDIETGVIHLYNAKDVRSVQVCEVVYAKFPSYKDIIPANDRGVGLNNITFCPLILARLTKGIGDFSGITMSFGKSKLDPILINYNSVNLDAISVLMPMRS